MAKLHFDVRDIFRVVRLGWSGKKIWVGLIGLIVAYAGYSILVSIAHLVSGTTLSALWHRYGLFPGARMAELTLLGTVIHVLGMLFVLAVLFLASSMICKITYQQLRGDDFYSSGDAWRFLKSNWTGVLFGPIAVLAMFVFFVVVGIVIGWLAGVIPWVGELGFAIFFIPIFFAALIAIFIAIVFVVALMMSPAIVGTVGEDTLEVIIQSFSLTWSQPWRLLFYSLWMNVSVLIGVAILGSFMGATLWLLSWACGLFMGQKLANLLVVAHRYIPCPSKWDTITCCLPPAVTPSGAEMWAGRILAVMLLLLMGVLLSYGMSAKASGFSLIYVILRKRKDDENLLEWEDETLDEDTPEVAEPEAQEESEASEPSEETGEGATGDDAGEAPEAKPDGGN